MRKTKHTNQKLGTDIYCCSELTKNTVKPMLKATCEERPPVYKYHVCKSTLTLHKEETALPTKITYQQKPLAPLYERSLYTGLIVDLNARHIGHKSKQDV